MNSTPAPGNVLVIPAPTHLHTGMWNADGYPGAPPLDLSALKHSAPLLMLAIAIIFYVRPFRRLFFGLIKMMLVIVTSALGGRA
jgi:hypothetical protein